MERNKNGYYQSDVLLPGAVLPLETDGKPPLVCHAGEGDNCPALQFRDAAFALEVGELLLNDTTRAK